MRIFFSIIFIFNTLSIYAQQVIDLDPLSVTTSRFAQKVSETGRSLTVIDSKLISKLPAVSIDELLKYAGAVEIQQRGPAGAQADIVIRGGTFQQVLVLLDGVKLNDPITGHFSAYMPIPIAQIDRIEILKGPAAAIYGSEAVGGVINIISKTFAAKQTEKNTIGHASIVTGEYGYLAANAGIDKTNKTIRFSVAAQTNNASGRLLRGHNRGYFHNNLISANTSIQLKQNIQLFLHSSFDSRDFAAQNFYTTFVSDTATEQVKTWWNHAKLKFNSPKNSNEIDIAYKYTSDHYQYNPLATANDNKSEFFSTQYLHTKTISTKWFYHIGLLTEFKSIRSNDRGNHSNGHAASFGSVVYKAKQLTIHPGIRIAYDQNYGLAILPQANIAYKMGKIVLKANTGRAIRSADFTERYNNFNKKLVTSGSIGNPDLQTENSWSYEGGADLFLKKLKLSATYFYRNQDEVIDWVTTPYSEMPRKDNLVPTGTYALAKNIKKLKTSGFEFELNYSHSISANQQLYFNATATFLQSKGAGETPSFYILSHAKILLQQSLIYNYKNFGISFTSIYKERKPQQAAGIKAEITPHYWVLNSQLTYQYKKMKAFITIQNIGNVEYSDLLGSKMPGSWTTGGISMAF